MRYKNALLPTLKEAPADATATSHILLTRAGCVRQIGAGSYSFLPLGLRVLRKIENIVRQEMDRTGAQEVSLPTLLPAEYFKESGRWDSFGDALFRLNDRRNADCHLAPTCEEVMTDLARREIKSYRNLPQNIYQIQTKYRDEPRPRGGLLRVREFLMKDAYSFDESEEAALQSYETMRRAYIRIFDMLGFDYRLVAADSGSMGGTLSTEFQVLVQSGEDLIAACPSCDFAANLEVAAPLAPQPCSLGAISPREKVSTRGKGSIAAVADFLKVPPQQILKSLVYRVGDSLALAIVRGDHEVNEVKLAAVLGVSEVKLAPAIEVKKFTGSSVGSVGPVGFQGKVYIDHDAAQVEDAVCGALESEHHFLHVQFARDFQAESLSLRSMSEGDSCPACQKPVKIFRGIEAGHIFVLGTHYSKKMGANFIDKEGNEQPLVMGCYGVGITRLVAAMVEQHHDKNGIIWPLAVAPFPVHLCALGESESVKNAVESIEKELLDAGIECLIDDRDERPGVKFKDADLIGIPFRITVGERSLKEGKVELKARSEQDPKAAQSIDLTSVARHVIELVRTGIKAS